jgi:hypothetical protein
MTPVKEPSLDGQELNPPVMDKTGEVNYVIDLIKWAV